MSEWSMPGVDEWTVPGYAEERLLGRGVSGRVVAAVNQATGQRVAIKYFDDDLLVRDTAFLRGFRSDAERLMSLDSQHVARLIDYVEQPGQGAAIVMSLVEGISLREVIARGGPLGAEAALVVLKDSLLALDAAQSLGVPHRDLKPENLLINANGWCMLTDFGVAVKTSKRMAAGTPAYMAPELWGGASSSPSTDIYAATAVLWESVTGSPPFSGRLRHLRRQHKSASVPIEQFEQPIQGLIAWGMAKNPADRPESARSFVDDLEARAAAAYGENWVEHGRSELGERAAALLPLLEGKGGNSATATRVARRKRLNFVLVGTSAAVTLIALAALALSGMSGKAQPSSLAVAVSSAQVIVTPPVAASTCSTATAFTYSGTVTDTGPGKLSYRWLYSSGKQGPVQTLSFTVPGHRQVTGGTVAVSKAGAGWAEIKVVSGIAKTSNKATYRLLCSTAKSGITLSASVRPKAQTVYSCAAASPSLTAIGSIKTKKAESVSYYWALADGQNSAKRTVTFKAAGTKTLPPLTITPPALPASGEVVLVVTKPVAAASKPATYTVSCVAPAVATVTTPVLPTSPASSGSSGKSSPNPGKTAAKPTHTATAPTKPGPTTAAPTTPAPTTAAPTTPAPTTAAPTTPAPTTAAPTTPVPTTPIPSES